MKAQMTSSVMIFPQAMQARQAFGKVADQGCVPHATTDLVLLRASRINGCSWVKAPDGERVDEVAGRAEVGGERRGPALIVA